MHKAFVARTFEFVLRLFSLVALSPNFASKTLVDERAIFRYLRRMPLEDAFLADCPYGPEGLLLDEILEIDADASRLVARMPVHAELPLTRTQRAHPQRHPRHINGGLMVHMTGMLAFAHAYYVLGLRHGEGWIGYGGRIYDARYLSLASMEAPLELHIQATRQRVREKQAFVRYDFRFVQSERDVYASDQSAMWQKIDLAERSQEQGQ